MANVGDAIYQNDVVQTGSSSTIGLVLDDGSTFNLSANARFLLNDLSYDPNSTSNSLFLTLVQGAASFVAGQVAKTGDMKVATPTASIGIRGTAVNLDISSTDGKVSISVVDQQDGLVHAVQVFNNAGVLIGTVTSNGTSLTLTPTANFDVIAQQVNKTPDQVAQEFSAFQQVLSTYDAAKQIFPNLPQHTDNSDHQNNNNTSPNSTTKFAGSPPLNPPGTEYQPPVATTKTQTASAQATPTTVVVTTTASADPSLTKQVAPPIADPIVPVVPVVIPVNVVSLPFVVTSPSVVPITTGSADHTGPVMSANGDVVYDPDGAIYFYSRAANTTTTIVSPANGWNYGSPTISSDGRYIFYQGANGGSSYVFVYGTDPSDPSHYHVQTLLGLGQAPAVSGDGGTIVVSQASGNIAIYDLQGNLKGTIAPAAVGSSGALWLPSISADGHVIAFWNSDVRSAGGSGDLYAFNLSTAAIVHVAGTVSGAGTAAPTVSADGHLVAYQSTDAAGHSEIYLYDLQTSSIVFQTANSSGSSYSPVLSPDGHFIVFTSDAQLTGDDTNTVPDVYVVDVTSPSNPIYKLVSESGGVAAASGVAISAGGQYVAYGSNSNIFFADPTSGHSAVIVETANSPSVLTADGLISLTGDSSGVQISVADQFGNPTSSFSASFDGAGHIQWNFSEARSDFAALAYGKDATQEFVITLSAETGTLTIPIFVTVHNGVQPTISVADFAPVASPVSLQDGQESVPYTITSGDLLSHVVDVDGPSLSIASLSIQSGDGTLSQIDSQTWTFSPAAGFSGHVVLNYQVTDSIKSAGSTASFNIALPLAITSINPDSGVAGDFITKDSILSVSGTNGALGSGERIQVSSDNGATWTDVAQTTATTWSYADPTAHNTNFTYQVRVLDLSNVSINSAAQAIVVDTTPPTLTITGGDGATNQSSLDVAGTVDLADAGSLVTVFDDGQSMGSAIAGSDGKWSVTVSLHDGANSLTAQAADTAGNLGTSNAVVVTLDTTAPTEAVAITAIATDSGGSSSDFITNDTTLTVSGTNGTLAAGEKIQVSSDNGTTWADVTQSTTTTWSYVDPTTHPASFSYQVRIIDTAGNIGTTASQAVTIDTTAPTETLAVTAIATDSGSSSSDFITSDTTLTVSGTNGALASGEKIQVSSDNGTTWADVTQSTTTSWSYVDPTTHPASFSYQVRIIDTAGNIGTTASQAVTIDTTAPAEAVAITAIATDSGGSSSDFITNDTTLTVSGTNGTLASGEKIQVSSDNGTTWADVTQSTTTTWSYVDPTTHPASFSYQVRIIDTAGNIGTTASQAVTIDTTAPTITISNTGGSTNQASQTIAGTVDMADAGATVTVYDNSTPVKTAIVQNDGSWSAQVTLNSGGNSLTAKVTDLAGNTTTSNAVVYTLSTIGPAVTEHLTADTGSSALDQITSNPALSGTGLANAVVNFTIDGTPTGVTTTADTLGNWSFTPTGLGNGQHTIVASQTDTFGNTGSASLTFTLDTTAPTEAVAITAIATDSGGSSSDFITNDTTLTVSGTNGALASGEKIQVSSDNGTTWADVTQSTTTSWSYVDPTTHPASFSYQVRIIDTAGNIGTTASQAVTIDTTAPTETLAVTAIATDSGTAGDFITSDTTLTVSGTNGALATGEKIQVSSDNGTTWADVTQSTTTTWSYVDPTTHPASFSYQVRIIDTAGNIGTTASQAVTIDTTAPTETLAVTAIATDSGTAGDFITNDTTLTVSGTNGALATGEKIQVSSDNGTTWADVTQSTTTTWSYVDPTTHAISFSYQVRIIDTAGNIGTTASQAVTIDTTAPTEAVAITAIATDSGSSSTDFITNDTTLTVSGTNGALASGEKIQVSSDNGTTWADVTQSTTTSWSYVDPTTHPASFSYQVRIIDTAGNIGTTASQAVTIDTTAPTITISNTGGSTNQASQTIAGTVDMADAGATVTVYDNSTPVKTAIVQNDGSWSAQVTLNSGGNSLTAKVTDLAGNTTTSNAVVYTLSTIGPAVTEHLTADTGSSALDQITSNPALSGTGLANAVVNFTIDGTPTGVTTTADTLGNWSFTPTGLGNGQHTIVASQTDTFGNTGSASLTFTLDTTAPTEAVAITAIATDSGGSSSDFITNDTTLTVSGTNGALASGEKIQVSSDNGTTWADVTQSTTTSWSYVDPTTHPASFSYQVRIIDTAGNIGTTASQAVTIDTTAPTETLAVTAIATDSGTAGDFITSDTTLTVSGTNGALATGEKIQVSSDNGTTWADVTQSTTTTWSYVDPTTHPASFSYQVRIIDTAGNIGTTASQAVTIDTTAPTETLAVTAIATDSGTAGDFITNDTTLTVSGTNGALATGEKIQVSSDNGTTWADVTQSTTTTWSYVDPTTHAISFSYQVRIIDTAGNIGTTASQAVTIDTTAPTETLAVTAIATDSGTAGDFITNDTTLTVSGTNGALATGEKIQVSSDNGTTWADVTQSTTTSWSYVDPTTHPASFSYQVRIIDTAGNIGTTASQAVTIDTTAPTETLAVTAIATDSGSSSSDFITNDTTLTVSGTNGALASGEKIQVSSDNGTTWADVTQSTTTSWSYVDPTTHPASFSYQVRIIDTAGNIGTTASQAVTIDTTAPTETLAVTAIATDSGTAGDFITSDTTLTVSGTNGALATGEKIQVSSDNGTTWADVTQSTTTTWSYVDPTTHPASFSYQVRIIDTAGNIGTTASQAVTIDTTAPAEAVAITAIATDSGGSSSDFITNDTTLTVSGTNGTLASGEKIQVSSDNGTTWADVTQSTTTTWSYVDPTTHPASFSYQVRIIDTAGNIGTTASQAVTIDTTAPTETLAVTAIATDSGTAGDFITNDTTLTVSGTNGALATGEKIQVSSDNGTTWADVTQSTTTTWSYVDPTTHPASFSYQVRIIDTAGNIGTTASQAVTIDTTAPTEAVAITAIATDSGSSSTDFITNDTTLTVSGTNGALASGEKIQVSADGGTSWADVTQSTATSWSYVDPTTHAISFNYQVRIIDTAGNIGTTASQAVTIDTTAPTEAVAITAIATDSGTAGDFITNDTTLTVSGTNGALATGEKIQVSSDNGTTWADVTQSTTTTWSYVDPTTHPASFSYQVRIIDTAGNIGTTASQAVTIDTAAPTEAVAITAIATDSGTAGDFITNDTTLTVSGTNGTLTSGEKIQVSADGGASWADVTQSTTTTWSYVDPTTHPASFSYQVRIIDTAGNIGTTASQAVTIDTTAPTITISNTGGSTNQASQTIAGTVDMADAGATVTVYDNSTPVKTAIVQNDGSWSAQVTLNSGGNSLTAKVTDLAGNTTTSTAVTFNLTLIAGGWGNPSGGSWTTAANWSSGTIPGPTSNVVFNPVGATAPYVVTIPAATAVTVNAITLNDPNVTLLDEANLTIVGSLVEEAGTFEISNGGSLSLGGGASLLIDFAGSGGNLLLSSAGGFTGTIDAVSTATGAVTISGPGSVTTTSGDAIDLLGSSGTQANPGSLNVSITGTITSAANGILIVQNAVGDITVNSAGPVVGAVGDGILTEVGASGSGNITVTATGSVTGTGAGMNGVLAENLNASNNGNVTVTATGGASGNDYGIEALTYGNGKVSVEAGGTVSSSKQYGIRALTYGSGNVSVVTDAGSMINSAGSGINAINQDTVIAASIGTTVSVTTNGTINFGATLNLSGAAPAGIVAGFYGANGTTNSAINGTVIVTNSANITQTSGATGYGINAYNDGNGNVTVNDGAGTKISTMQNGIVASLNGGAGDVAVNVGTDATIAGKSGFGIDAHTSSVGNVRVTMADRDIISSKSDGINAYNQAAAIPFVDDSTITVSAYGTINSGATLHANGTQPAGILAGYKGGANNTINSNVFGSVNIDNFANVIAGGGDGIRGYNYGVGNITITDEANTTIIAPGEYGIRESNYGSGNEQVTTSSNDLIVSGSSGINVANFATAIASTAGSTVRVVAQGTIYSGTVLNGSGSQPQGIVAGYYGSNGTTNNSINGTVSIDNYANIAAAAGYAVQAYNQGNGSVTVTEESNTSVVGAQYGIGGYSLGTSGPATATTSGATSTSSSILNFVSVPSWIVAGMTVYDVTTGKSIGTVSSTTGTTVILSANASNAVASGDLLSFPSAAITNGSTSISSATLNFASTPSWITGGMTVYDVTTGKSIGTVGSTNGSTVTLTTNSSSAVGSGDILSFGDVNINVLSNATIAAGALYGLTGIAASTNNAANIVVTTSSGDTINSGGRGISINSAATNASAVSQILTTAYGTINSGFDMTTGGGQPGGIWAGYNGGTGTFRAGVAGSVTIDNFATINAATGVGIGAYNYGVGNISVTAEATSAITAPYQAVSAFAQGGGSVTVANNGIFTSSTGTGIAVGTGSSLSGAGNGVLSVTNTGTKDSNGNFTSGIIQALGASYNAGAITAVVQINNSSTKASTFTNSGLVRSTLYTAGSPLNWAVSSYFGGNTANNGAVTVTNSGVIFGNVNLNVAPSGTSSFQNQASGVWNILGANFFNGTASIANAGTINIAGPSQINGGSLSIANSGVFDLAAMAVAYLAGNVSGTGSFNIGAQASLEFGGAVAAGQTVSFGGEQGLLILDSPSTFSASIVGAVAGDIIQAGSGYTPPSGFSSLSGNLWLMLPTSTPMVLTGSLGPQSLNPTPAQQFVQLSSATISSSTAIGLNIFTGDSDPTHTLFAAIDQSSSIFVTGSFSGVNLATDGANIAVFNAGAITSTGGTGLSTTSGSGATTIDDFASISGLTGIRAVAGGTAYTSAATPTTSNTLSFASTPGSIVAGLAVFDETTGKSIGTVQSTTSTTVLLAANAANVVGAGDTLSFGAPTAVTSGATSTQSNVLSFASTPSWIVPGTAVYDQTTGAILGTISSTNATTATLAENAASPVGSGDTLAFAGPISINVGQSAVINGPTATASAATATTSSTLSFASALPWVAAGMTVYDMTTGQAVGTVSSTSGATVILAANAASAVGNLDVLSFLASGSQGIVAQTSSGSVSVNTGASVNIVAGGNGINVQNRGKLVAPGALTVDAAGKISSGLVSGSEPAAIQVAYLGGTSSPSSIPNPPLSGIFGDVTIDSSATIAAYSGFGINAFTYGTGDISVSNSGSITATAAGNTNGTANPTTGLYNPTTAQVGINLVNYGDGNITLVTPGAITSGSAGIYASNAAIGSQTSPVGTAQSPVTVTVVANGPISSGANLPNGGNAPGGILANIDPGNITGYDGYVYGNVLVSASGSSINALAGDGIRAFNHAQGDVTVNIGANETITALSTATGASGNLAPIGIALNAYGPGDVTVSTSIGDVITSGSTGINANQQATAIAAAANVTVAINAAGTINAGNIQNDVGGTPAAINAGFYNGGAALPNVNGSVIINNAATIIAAARGLSGYNYGNGDVTINSSASVTVTGDTIRANSTTTTTTQVSEYGIEAATWGGGSGDVAVNIYSGAISATATPTGTAAAATPTSSTTLSFGSTPIGITAGMTAYDVTTGRTVGTVSATTGTTVTLAANAVAAVANGDMLSFFTAITGSAAAATSTSSATLSFGSTPSGISAGMVVYDLATGAAVGTVSSTTATTVTLNANAAAAIASGDTLSFATPITNQVYAVFAENNDSGNISVITSPGTSIYSSGVGINATNESSPVAVATLTATTSAATATTSRTLTFAAAPAWITAGNSVYDVTSGNVIGTVSSTTATTVTLTANAVNAVSQGDKLSFAQLVTTSSSTPTSSNTLTFSSTPAWIVAGMTVYDITTGKTVGTVASTTGGTVTLAANAANPVGSGDALSFPEIATATAATSTSSQTLSFAATPSWIATGMTVYDDTTGAAIGTVASTTGTTVTLAANASSAVAIGDVLSFASSSIVVTSSSTITSGNVLTGTGSQPAGIIASYLGGDAIPSISPVIGANGSVTVNNFGDITAAAGDGIRAVTYGIGDITVNDGAGTITALGGPTPTKGFGDGIDARAWGPGNILVTTTSGVTINAGSSGISAINYAPSAGNSFAVPSTSQITVIAYGAINSGVVPTLSGDAPAGILAGYNPGVSSANPVDAVNPLVAGNVLVQDYASITAAAGTDGIRAFNYGTGSVSIIIESGATIAGAQYGASGFAYDGGNVSITNYASINGTAAAIEAGATGAGTVLIDNYGTITDAVVSSAAAITLDNEVGGIWTLTGNSSFTGPTTLINNGSIAINGTALLVGSLSGTGAVSVSNNGSLEVGTAGGAAAGSIVIDSGATATLAGTFGSTTFVDNGTIVFTGVASLTGTLSGSGQIDIGVGANLAIASVAATAPSIAFQGFGTLTLSSADLDGTLTFSPIISGLDATDKINFAGSVTSAFWNAGILTLENGTTPVAYLHLSGDYGNSTFTVTQANGVSQIVDPPAAGNIITNGALLELSAPSSDKISFAGTGTLVLDQPASYVGQIAGFSGSDVLTLKGFDSAHTTADAIYNQQNDTTVLTVTDTSDHHAVSLILDGSYSSTAFNVAAHENGGVDITTSPETVPVGGELELNHASSDTITFRGGTGALVIDQPESFTGEIANFTGTAPDAAHSDVIDVRGINYDSIGFKEAFDASTGVLSLTDGLHGATIKFDGFKGTLDFASDNRGGTLITDPPAASVPLGDAVVVVNSDQFVFKTPAASHVALERFERSESLGLDHSALDSSDAAGFRMWHSDHAMSVVAESLITSSPDGEQIDADMMLLKKVALASLHTNDFVLPVR